MKNKDKNLIINGHQNLLALIIHKPRKNTKISINIYFFLVTLNKPENPFSYPFVNLITSSFVFGVHPCHSVVNLYFKDILRLKFLLPVLYPPVHYTGCGSGDASPIIDPFNRLVVCRNCPAGAKIRQRKSIMGNFKWQPFFDLNNRENGE